MRITLSRMILLSGLLHIVLVGAAATAQISAKARPLPPPAYQVKLVRRAEIPWLKLPEPKVQAPQKKTPEPIVAKKEAPPPEIKKEAPPVEKVKPKVPLLKEVDIDMTLVADAPAPKVQVAAAPVQPKSPARIRAVDMNMELEIAAKPRPVPAPRGSEQGKPSTQAISSASAGAGYVSMAMEIAPEKVSRPGAGEGKTPGISVGRSILGLGAKAHAATLDGVSMTLDIQQGGGDGMKSRTPGPLMGTGTGGQGKPARVLSTGGRGMGDIELPLGLPESDGPGKVVLASAGPSSPQGTPGARMIVRHAEGPIALGVPLAFRLADVGDETASGSAYVARSMQLKRLLESHRLPSTPVTVPIGESDGVAHQGDPIVGMSYCKNQIVLQFGSGKQQVVTLVAEEPYPRFEIRLAPNGSQNVPVGTKLEEITACVQTLQHVLKAQGS